MLAAAVIATLVFTAIAQHLQQFSGAGGFILYYYHAPIGFAFVIFLLERLKQFRQSGWRRKALDLLVVGLALSRVVSPLPFFSGHSLFLSYMVLTASSRLSRGVALLVLAEVIWIKIVVLQDATVWGGMAIGLVVFVIWKRKVTY